MKEKEQQSREVIENPNSIFDERSLFIDEFNINNDKVEKK